MPPAFEIARRYGDVVARNDAAGLIALFADGGVVWHNTDGLEQTPAENAKVLAYVHRTMPDLVLADVRITPTDEGFVQRHRMTGTAPGGPVDAASCLVVSLDAAGAITRVEEYLDSRALANLRPSG